MRRTGYIPDRGDFVWINLNPPRGHEQAGHRTALVLSPKLYNRKTGLCVICPGTRQAKGYLFEVVVPPEDEPGSVVLADHVRCIAWRRRGVRLIRKMSGDVLDEVVAKLEALIINPDEHR